MSYRGKDKTQAGSLPLYEDDLPATRRAKITSGSSRLHWRALGLVVLVWVLVVHYFERVSPRRTIRACQWHHWEDWGAASQPHRVAIVADPQLVDEHTYPQHSRLVNYVVRTMSDNYLRRNHRLMHHHLDPDTTIFLGDLFDGGREWGDQQWFDEYKRFNAIFPTPPNRRTVQLLPGNHDIGYQTVVPSVKARFLAFFGESNDWLEIGNHTVVLIDSILLSHPDPLVCTDARQFLTDLDLQINPQMPRILFSHVPLYRFNDRQLCGPLREKGDPFPVQRGYQYQTVVDYEVSQELLHTIDPDLVFSGDDHDYCHVQHHFEFEGVDRVAEEISVKTASMTCGVQYPAIQLLLLHNPYDPSPKPKLRQQKTRTYRTQMCYLPLPYLAIKTYAVVLMLQLSAWAMVYVVPQRSAKILATLSGKQIKNAWRASTDTPRNWRAFGANATATLMVAYTVLALYYVTV